MNLLTKLTRNIVDALKQVSLNITSNFAEYWTLLMLVVALPVIIGYLTEPIWGILVSCSAQALIGLFYIRSSTT